MTTAVWSPNLKNVIKILAELQPHKRKTLLKSQKFIQSSNLSEEEKKLLNKIYLKSKQDLSASGIWQ